MAIARDYARRSHVCRYKSIVMSNLIISFDSFITSYLIDFIVMSNLNIYFVIHSYVIDFIYTLSHNW